MGLLYVKTADGRKKPSVFVWLGLLAIMLGVSIFLVTNNRETGLDELTGNTREKKVEEGPIPVEKTESAKASGNMDAETINEMEAQLARERNENNGFMTRTREEEIRDKYLDAYQEKLKENFRPSVSDRLGILRKPDPTPTPDTIEPEEEQKQTGYRTLAERLGENGNTEGGTGSSGAIDFSPPTAGAGYVPAPEEETISRLNNRAVSDMKNIMVLGTFIPCVLDGDIVTSALAANVWGNVVIDVTFRRQLQLPKGLVRVRGKTATEPIQNVVDIIFDTMVFSDGTELPINGFAYSAFDPRYPHRFRTRGIPGELIVPPMWIKLQSLVYAAALGASDAYIENYVNQNTGTETSFTTTPVIDPVTGATQNVITEEAGQPVNSNIGATIGLSAGQSALEDLVATIQKDMEKYQPYLIVEKGTPFFIQLENTVDIGTRRINGAAIAKEAELQRNIALARQGVPMPRTQVIYPPGDARANYTGVAPTDLSDSTGASSIPNMSASIESLQNNINRANVAGGQTGSPGGQPPTAEALQRILSQ